MTGRYPFSHQLIASDYILSPKEVTLAEVLKLYDYKTVAFTGGFNISSVYNVNQGFDLFFDEIEHGRLEDVLPPALNWLKTNYQLPVTGNRLPNTDDPLPDTTPRPFFLFLQAYDTHAPHKFPPKYLKMHENGYKGIFNGFVMDHSLGDNIIWYNYRHPNTSELIKLTKADINHIIANYDAALTYADKQLGGFFDNLNELGLDKNTIIVFLSDHGETHLERGRILKRTHGGLYEEGIHVPLIIKLPPDLDSALCPNSAIDQQVQLIDIMPTILNLLNIPVNKECQGESLVPLINGTALENFNQYVYTCGGTTPETYQCAVRTQDWKLLYFKEDQQNVFKNERWELYNFKNDPLEQYNLIEGAFPVRGVLYEKLNHWVEQCQSTRLDRIKIDESLYPEMQARMRKFGYWWLEFTDKDIGRAVTKTDNAGQVDRATPFSDASSESPVHKFSSEEIIIEESEKQFQSEEIIIE